MNLSRYAGRILLAVGVLAIGVWVTAEKLVEVSPLQFWVAIGGYLAAAEALWTYVERHAREKEARLPRQGLLRLTGREAAGGGARQAQWFYGGGRPRPADITAGLDAARECLPGLLARVIQQTNEPRVHVIEGPVGGGRSTLLLRLGKTLADEGKPVYYALSSAPLTGLNEVLKAASSRQSYLLIDDFDLSPEAPDILYQVLRSERPVVMVITRREQADEGPGREALHSLEPAELLDLATVHNSKATANDQAALARKLEKAGRLAVAGMANDSAHTLWKVGRQLQQLPLHEGLWDDFDRSEALPRATRLMLALAGAAEMALPLKLFAALSHPVRPAVWQRAGLIVADDWQVLPPAQPLCLDLLHQADFTSAEVQQACKTLLQHLQPHWVALIPRLLSGLAHCPQTRHLALSALQGWQAEGQSAPADLTSGAWTVLADTLDLSSPEARRDYPPHQATLADSLFRRSEWPAALHRYRQLVDDAVWAEVACFNVALTLTRLGQPEEAAIASNPLDQRPPQTVFLKAVVNELRGDYVAALDFYESARKADILSVAATNRLAFTYLRSGAPRAALPLFEALLSYTPQQPELYGGLAVAHLHSGMAQRAAAQSSRAIQAGIEPTLARKAVARAFLQANAYDRAAGELEACVSYAPTDLEGWGLLGETNRWLGRYERELECLYKLQELQPQWENRLMIARCIRDQGRPAEAWTVLHELLEEGSDEAELYLLAAITAGSCGDFSRQTELARQALAVEAQQGWGHYWLAEALVQAGDEGAAMEAYQAACRYFQLELKEAQTHRLAATLRQALQKTAEALGHSQLAAEAAREARREGMVCAAIGVEIMSVTARRSVPPEVFLADYNDPSPSTEPPFEEVPTVESDQQSQQPHPNQTAPGSTLPLARRTFTSRNPSQRNG